MNELKRRILFAVDSNDPSFAKIAKAVGISEDELTKPLSELMNDGYARMKEDIYDHDWVYRLNAKGRSEVSDV